MFGLVYFTASSLLISEKKKKVIAPIWSTFLRVFCWFQKKSHHLETSAWGRKVRVGMLGSLGGEIFVWGGVALFCPLPSCGPVHAANMSKWSNQISPISVSTNKTLQQKHYFFFFPSMLFSFSPRVCF